MDEGGGRSGETRLMEAAVEIVLDERERWRRQRPLRRRKMRQMETETKIVMERIKMMMRTLGLILSREEERESSESEMAEGKGRSGGGGGCNSMEEEGGEKAEKKDLVRWKWWVKAGRGEVREGKGTLIWREVTKRAARGVNARWRKVKAVNTDKEMNQ